MNCEVRKSNIHGRGVFAKRNIKKGEKLCIYDGQIIDIGTPGDSSYDLGIPNTRTMSRGYREPRSSVGIGQFINDGARYIWTGVPNDDAMALVVYMRQTSQTMNCKPVFHPKMIFIEALRDIKKDEELLMFYGLHYWTAQRS